MAQPGKDPYFLHSYRVNFDGTGLTALTEADGNHTVTFSPDRPEPFVAKGVMAILNAQGTLIGKSELAPHRFLPGESAELGGEYPGELAAGHYRIFVTYDYDGHTSNQSAEVDVR